MRLLCFRARRFRWKACAPSLPDVPPSDEEGEARDALVAFVHAEARDARAGASLVRKAQKHIEWVARKGEVRRVVLHSFTNLGGETAEPEFARDWLEELAERLRGKGYEARTTPFGQQCEWDLAVGGESMAKVWKEL